MTLCPFYSSFGLMKYPYTKTIHLDLQTRIHLSLVLVIIASITAPYNIVSISLAA